MFRAGTFVALSVVATNLALRTIALALPSPTASTPALEALQKSAASVPELQGVQFFLEEEDGERVIFVTPANRKSQSGGASRLRGDACDVLKDRYEMAYAMPHVAPEKYIEVAREGHQTAFFDYWFGNYVRNAGEAEQLHQQKVRETEFIEKHRNEFDAFNSADAERQSAESVLAQVQADIIAIQNSLDDLSRNVAIAETSEEREALRREYREHFSEVRPELRALNAQLSAARKDVLAAQAVYRKASAEWLPYQREHDNIKEIIQEAVTWMKAMQIMARDQFLIGEDALEVFESVPVGQASAAYTIYGSEIDAATRLVAANEELSGYTVKQMPLNNVTLSMVRGDFPYQLTHAKGTETLSTSKTGSGNAFQVGATVRNARAAFLDAEGKPLPFQERLIVGDEGSGIFQTGISRGAWCTGLAGRAMEEHKAPGLDGKIRTWVGAQYVERKSSMLAQAVALNYDYYVAATPLAVDCNAQIEKTMDFFKDTGTSRGFLSAKSWDKETYNQAKNSGITCVVQESPDGDSTLEEQQAKTAKIEETMRKEVAAELLTYADATFTTTTSNPVMTPELQNEIGQRGPAANAFCRFNYYCEVGNLVLSLAQGIFGTTTETNVERHQHFTGEFKRSYRDSSYRRIHGHAAIDLTVE